MPENMTAVVAGHICLDVFPDFTQVPPSKFETIYVPGHLTIVGPAAFSTGGPVSNTGLALNHLGVKTRLMGKLGDDVFGQAVQKIVQTYLPGEDSGMLVDPDASTSYTLIISPPGVDRIFLHSPGANDTFSAADIRYDVVCLANLFHFGYPPIMRRMYAGGGEGLREIFQRVKALEVTTSLDMAFPDPDSPGGKANWRKILGIAMPFVDIFLPSIEEILYMLHRDTYNALCSASSGGNILPLVTPGLLSDLSQELLDMGARIVVIKMGDRGLYLRTAPRSRLSDLGRACPPNLECWADQELWAPCFRTNVVGTTGSGDATIAGFLSALLRGFAPADALTAAVAVGACNVEAADALSGLRLWEETLARVEAGWERLPLRLQAPGWTFDARHQIFRKES